MPDKTEWLQAQSKGLAAPESVEPMTGPSRLNGALRFDDSDQFRQHLQQVNAEITLIGQGHYQAELQLVPAGRVVLQRGWQSLAHVCRIATPQDHCLFLFSPRKDQAPSNVATAEVRFADIIYAPGGSQDYYRGSGDTAWAALSPRLDDLMTAAETLGGVDLDGLRGTRVITPPLPVRLRLLEVTRSVGNLAATDPELLRHPHVAQAVEDGLLRAMAACLGPIGFRHSMRGRVGRGAVIMRRFEAYLEANADRPVHLTEMCAAIGVRARTLRKWCHEYLGIGPIRYLHLRRMHLARRALLHADPTASSVTRVANDFGFAELGRFSGNYRRMFGEPPLATLRRPV